MKVLVTGSKGFIGLNISLWLKNHGHEVLGIDKDNNNQLEEYINQCNFIIHLAGSNRPLTNQEFYDVNTNFTKRLVDSVKSINKNIPIIFSSTIKVLVDNDYGKSKKQAEDYLLSSCLITYLFRLSNVFGKWARPNYNSVVATFCHNIVRDLPIQFSDETNTINMVYIDDVCKTWVDLIEGRLKLEPNQINEVKPIYTKTLRELADSIYEFKKNRTNLNIVDQGDGYTKKMYATYLSYLPENSFSYPLNMNIDNRGSFTEFIKTKGCGQVSVNIIKSGVTKGNHYHNTKNEKFLVVSGICLIKFRRVGTDKIIEYKVSGDKLEVVDIPVGYTHNITNIGKTDSVVIMWANECFVEGDSDTYFEKVDNNEN